MKIGIDFGTNNTIVACLNESGEAVPVNLSLSRQYCVPTVLYFETPKDYIIGDAAAKRGIINPEACIRNFKTDFDSPRKIYEGTAENGEPFRLNPLQAATKFMQKIIIDAQRRIGMQIPALAHEDISSVVVTVPVGFSSTARGVVKKAVGFVNQRTSLMAEPTAAAVCYIRTHQEMLNKNILVYDFGGGTFDLCVLSNRNGICKVVDKDNDPHLGGNDLTRCIVADMIERINEDFGLDMPMSPNDYFEGECSLERSFYLKNYAQIWEHCERIKIDLSRGLENFTDEIRLTISNQGIMMNATYTYQYKKSDVNALIAPEIEKTITKTRELIDRVTQSGSEIHHIILAGGSSQVPLVKQRLDALVAEIGRNTGENALRIFPDGDTPTLIARGAVLSNGGGVPITFSQIGIAVKNGNIPDEFYTILESGEKVGKENGRYAEVGIMDRVKEFFHVSVYERDPRVPRINETVRDGSVRKIDELIICDLPDGVNRTARIFFAIDSDETLEIQVEIRAGDKVISREHTFKRSNLFDE